MAQGVVASGQWSVDLWRGAGQGVYLLSHVISPRYTSNMISQARVQVKLQFVTIAYQEKKRVNIFKSTS